MGSAAFAFANAAEPLFASMLSMLFIVFPEQGKIKLKVNIGGFPTEGAVTSMAPSGWARRVKKICRWHIFSQSGEQAMLATWAEGSCGAGEGACGTSGYLSPHPLAHR